MELKDIIKFVEGKAKEVYKELGIGHTETVYEKALEVELKLKGIEFSTQVVVPIYYKGHFIGYGRADIVINNKFVIELKSTPYRIGDKERAQITKYMEPLKINSGIVINFTQKEYGEIAIINVDLE